MVLFHAGLTPFKSGFVGVDIFFVISGYLLGGIIFREGAQGSFSFIEFYARRARRILPALILVMIAILLAGLVLLSPPELSRLGAIGVYVAAAISNVRFWQVVPYFTPDAHLDPFLMTWSLGVEEQFYLVFPAIVMGCLRFAPRQIVPILICSSLVSFGLSVALTGRDHSAAFYLLPSRAWELGVGGALAISQARGAMRIEGRAAGLLSALGAVGLVLSAVVFEDALAFPGWRAAIPVACTLAVLATNGAWLNRTVIGSAPFTWLGRLSYSWYLWHWPVLAYLRIATVGQPRPAVVAGAVGLSLLAAMASLYLVETPFRRAVRTGGSTLTLYFVVLAIVAALSASLRLSDGFPARSSTIVASLVGDSRLEPCIAFPGQAQPVLTAECVPPAAVDRSAVALIGDSHAHRLGRAMASLAESRGWNSAVLAKAGCRPSLGVAMKIVDPLLGPNAASECEEFNRRAFALVLHDPKIKIVVLAAYWRSAIPPQASNPTTDPGLEQVIRRLRAAGKRIYIVQDVPSWSSNPVNFMLSRELASRRFLADLSGPPRSPQVERERVAEIDSLLAGLARREGARYLETRHFICDPVCSFRQGDAMLYVDQHHISTVGAKLVLRGLAGELHE